MSYTLNRIRGKVVSIRRIADGADIPLDAKNRDYRAFVAWNAVQNPPLDLADEFDLQSYKADKILAVDEKTAAMLADGFVFDAVPFSLSSDTQTTWLGLILATQGNKLPFPITVGGRNHKSVDLKNAAEVNSFYEAGLGRANYALQGGAKLKALVEAATTKAQVDIIVDDRQ